MSELSFSDLRSFLTELEREGELVTIEVPVDPELEIAEIHRRAIAAAGPALLFLRPRGADFPVVTNLFGTARRAELAFGHRPARLIRRLVEASHELMPPSISSLWGARDLLLAGLRVGTQARKTAPVLEHCQSPPALDRLPALRTWPEDGGAFLTLPLVYTEHPEGLGHNLGMYRMQIYDPSTTGMHWQIGKGGGFHYEVAEKRNRPLPVSVFLGGPPALTLAAIAPLPENVPELLLASLIAGQRLPMVEGPQGSRLVGTAEFALVGSVPPTTRRPEGPFGDHYGYYSLTHDYPIFEVSHLLHRRDAIFPATVVGKPRQEDFFIGDLLQELLSPLFPLVMPAVRSLWSYGETGYHSLSAAVVQDRYHREAMGSAFRILGEGQLSLTKFLLVIDQSIDLKNFPATLEHLLARTRPETDLYVFSNLSMDTLDYTGPRVNEGSKGVWVGLGEPVRDLPREFAPSVAPPSDISSVHVFCSGCLVVGGPTTFDDPGAPARFARHPAFADWPLVVVTDEPARAAASTMNFLWTTFTRFEPAADIHAADVKIVRNHLSYTSPVVIDARRSPEFPDELFCDPATAETVERRWKEYFPGGGVEMGDSDRGHLDEPS